MLKFKIFPFLELQQPIGASAFTGHCLLNHVKRRSDVVSTPSDRLRVTRVELVPTTPKMGGRGSNWISPRAGIEPRTIGLGGECYNRHPRTAAGEDMIRGGPALHPAPRGALTPSARNTIYYLQNKKYFNKDLARIRGRSGVIVPPGSVLGQ